MSSDAEFCHDRISALHEDLLVQILTLVPVKDAVKTMVLSKRWSFLWTMMHRLDYIEKDRDEKIVWDFLDKSLQLNKAPVLESLRIRIHRQCPLVDADLGKWVSVAVERCARELILILCHLSDPTSLPKRLYTCKTLVQLILSDKILVDVPSPACFPSLKFLVLSRVVYKDQDSHVKLLSSCPVLRQLLVVRTKRDNVNRFSVKVPSLLLLTYVYFPLPDNNDDKPLVIDSPGLIFVNITVADPLRDSFSIKNMPRLEGAIISLYGYPPNNELNFMTSFSSVRILSLRSLKVGCCNAINFPRLIELKLCLPSSEHHWMEPLMLLLHNAPKLKTLRINSVIPFYIFKAFIVYPEDVQLSWNQPSSVPGCLLSQLEIFEWRGYKRRSEEKQFAAYILANSTCLNTVGISPTSSCGDEKEKPN
ncbi:hypothetical protein CARUB_v10015399mg, partial [Capsella rubella]